MMNNCQNCGFEGQPGARFCRQCGSPLFVETEATMASTRQQRADPAPQYSPHASMPPASDDDAVDTARFYRPPSTPVPAYIVPTPRGTTGSFWLLLSFVCVLAVVGLISAVVVSTRMHRSDLGELISDRVERQIAREAERAARNAEQMASRAKEAARRAALAGLPNPPAPPRPPLAAGSKTLSLDDLVYPGAVIEKKVVSPGTQNLQVMTMSTPDSTAEVRGFYETRLGQPRNDRASNRLIFRSTDGDANTIVKVSPHATLKGKVEIELVRSSLK